MRGAICSQGDFLGGALLRNRADLFWATLGEGGLALELAAIASATRQPLSFASLGPTAYEDTSAMPTTYGVFIIFGESRRQIRSRGCRARRPSADRAD